MLRGSSLDINLQQLVCGCRHALHLSNSNTLSLNAKSRNKNLLCFRFSTPSKNSWSLFRDSLFRRFSASRFSSFVSCVVGKPVSQNPGGVFGRSQCDRCLETFLTIDLLLVVVVVIELPRYDLVASHPPASSSLFQTGPESALPGPARA